MLSPNSINYLFRFRLHNSRALIHLIREDNLSRDHLSQGNPKINLTKLIEITNLIKYDNQTKLINLLLCLQYSKIRLHSNHYGYIQSQKNH